MISPSPTTYVTKSVTWRYLDTKRGIIDPLVSKRLEKILNKKIEEKNVENGQKLKKIVKMVPNGLKWSQMVPNGPKHKQLKKVYGIEMISKEKIIQQKLIWRLSEKEKVFRYRKSEQSDLVRLPINANWPRSKCDAWKGIPWYDYEWCKFVKHWESRDVDIGF